MKKFAVTIMAAFAVSACATVPVYHPAITLGGSGFSDEKVDATHYIVNFQGDTSTSREMVEDYLLFRAAELTLDNNYDYFTVLEQSEDHETKVIPTKPISGVRHREHEHSSYSYPYYLDGYDWDKTGRMNNIELTRHAASTYIEMFEGKAPSGNPFAFNAEDIISELDPVECWKLEPHDEEGCRLDHSH